MCPGGLSTRVPNTHLHIQDIHTYVHTQDYVGQCTCQVLAKTV